MSLTIQDQQVKPERTIKPKKKPRRSQIPPSNRKKKSLRLEVKLMKLINNES
jgi:hypothetical protein